MNKEEKDVIDFLRVSAITKIEKTILSKEDVKCLLNYIDEYKKRTTFFREEIYRLNKKADKLQKEFKDLELAYGLYKDRYETLQKENDELKEGITGIEISRDTLLEDIKELKQENEDMREELQMYVDTDIMKLREENKDLKKEIENLIKENHKHIDYIANMKKKHEDKIRTKIKELEKTSAKELRYDFLMNRDEVKNAFIRILEELLN